MTPRLRRTCPGSCRPRRMRRSERTPLSAAVSPTRSVKEPQSAWIFIEAGGGVFFAFRVTSLCLGLLASSTCSIPAQEVTVLSSRALFSWYSVAKVILAFVWCMPYDVGMPKRGGSVHVATIRTKGAGDRVYTSYLLRRSYREGGRVRHENLGNLSHLPEAAIEAVRRVLAGEVLVAAEDRFQVTRSLPHGHVAAVLGVVRSLDLERLISREPSRERDLAVALICQRLLAPGSKLSATRRFSQTTLAEELTLDDAGEAELLSALDWLLLRQERIERTLARRHLTPGGFVLYDLSSSYFEGRSCPLDALLAQEEPIQGREELCLPCVIEPAFFSERGLRKAPGGREFRPGGKEPLTDEGHRQVPLPGGLPGDEPFKVKRAHDAEHGGHVSVRQRARNLEAVLRRDQDLARQHPADRLDGRFG